MWMKIVCCIIIATILNCDEYICGYVEPTKDLKISKNITIYRNKYGRLLGLLHVLKGFHHGKHVYHPLIMSKLWRASFEFELKPHAISANEISSTFPTLGLSNSGVGPSGIESIFHFGDNQQQSSVTIGGSNQISAKPDERDEIPIVSQHNAVPPVSSGIPNENEEKSERVLRHAIRTRADDELEEVESTNTESTTPTNDEEKDGTDRINQSPAILPTTTESKVMVTELSTKTEIPETTSISTILDNKHASTVPIPSVWLGYYDHGVHKPEFIEEVEFTTNYPTALVSEDISYVKYETPFKPSLPDYSHTYYSNFFVPLRYFKR